MQLMVIMAGKNPPFRLVKFHEKSRKMPMVSNKSGSDFDFPPASYPLHRLKPLVFRQLAAAIVVQLLPGELQLVTEGVDQELDKLLAEKAWKRI